MTKPKALLGLGMGGKRLWNQVHDDFEDLAQHEEILLLQACRIVDNLDRLQAVLDASEVIVSSPQGVKTHPALVEFRQQALALSRCVGALGIPADAVGQDLPRVRAVSR